MALVVIDLDGTLLRREGGVSPRNLQALERARDAGFEIVLATGRSWKESRRALGASAPGTDAGVMRLMTLMNVIIGAGGSSVHRLADGVTLKRDVIDAEVVADCARLLHEHGHRAQLLKDHHDCDHDYCLVGVHELDDASRWWFETHDLVHVEVVCPDDAHRRALTHGTLRVGSVAAADRLTRCADEIRRRHGDRIHARQWGALTATEVIGSSTHLLEIFTRGVDKWSAVEWICAERGVDPERVVAIGDGLNDVDMIANAGFGVAMGNAIDAVRDAADAVVAPYDRDGVAEAIDLALARYGAGAAR